MAARIAGEGGKESVKTKHSIGLSFLLGILSATVTIAGDFVLKDIHQNEIAPLKSIDDKPVVLIFISTDCPIANGYAPEINRIYEKYSEQKVKCTLVHVDPELTNRDATKHADEFALKPAVVVDRKHELVQAAGAKTTPEAVVFDSAGKVVYRGRINDRYADYGDRRNTVKTHNLRDTLDAVLAGKEVKVKETRALGCLIEPLK